MKKLVLGDNPFFGISHLNSLKSKSYLEEHDREKKAVEIIKQSSSLGFENFMISSHPETKVLLDTAGYYKNNKNLPKLIFIIPNVHKLNKLVASKGLIIGILSFFQKDLITLISLVIRDLFKLKPITFTLIKVFIYTMIKDMPSKNIEYICIHNILTDILLGISNKKTFEDITDAIKSLGFKPAFITLNPVEANKIIPKKASLCVYYNKNSYNICPSKDELIKEVKNSSRDWWAMGILASGAIDLEDALDDTDLKLFNSILYASISIDRIQNASKKILKFF